VDFCEVNMTAHHFIRDERSEPLSSRRAGSRPLTLGWPQFWLFSGILGGMLALLGTVLLASLVLR
jgi:hypothetical protein